MTDEPAAFAVISKADLEALVDHADDNWCDEHEGLEVRDHARQALTDEDWILPLLHAFGPKVIPLDVTPEGTYEESSTRWGMNPIYEAAPREIRDAVEAPEAMYVQRNYFALLRGEREA